MIKELIRRIICKDVVEEIEELETENYNLRQDLIETETELEEYKKNFDWVFYPIQGIKKIVNSDVIRNTVGDQINNKYNKSVIVPDPKEKLVTIEHFKKWLQINPVSEREYISTFHDCNAFSTILKGDVKKWDSELAFGEVYVRQPSGTGHALNLLVDTDLKLWAVEPQTDEIFKLPADWIIYSNIRF